MRARRCLLGLILCAACPRPPATSGPQPAPAQPQLPSATQQLDRLERDLAQLADPQRHSAAYAQLRRQAARHDRAALCVTLVFTVRDQLREGCQDEGDRQLFQQALLLLEQHLRGAPDAEWIFAGPTLLEGLQAAGRADQQPAALRTILAAGQRAIQGERLGELHVELANGMRLGCHLKAALALLEDALRLLEPAAPTSDRREVRTLARRDLALLRFLLGDSAGAQADLKLVADQLQADARAPSANRTELSARQEMVNALRTHLVERQPEGQAAAPLPPEDSPGWQALRLVQERASCPEAIPANPQLLRVPLPAPACYAPPG